MSRKQSPAPTDSKPPQWTRADVERLAKQRKYAEIERARTTGRLDDLLGIVRRYPPKTGPWSAEDVQALNAERRYDEIAAASAAGQLAHLLTDVDPDAA